MSMTDISLIHHTQIFFIFQASKMSGSQCTQNCESLRSNINISSSNDFDVRGTITLNSLSEKKKNQMEGRNLLKYFCHS